MAHLREGWNGLKSMPVSDLEREYDDRPYADAFDA
jgi:hypothetical protein